MGDDGSDRLFRALFEGHVGWAWSLARRLGVPARDVEDVTHEAFMRVHGALGTFDRARPPRPWLYPFVVHAALAHRRRAQHRNETLAADDDRGAPGEIAGDPALSPEGLTARDQAIERALAILDRLPEERRVVFVLIELEGLTAPEVARCLEIPVNTVSSRLRLAREAIAALRARGAAACAIPPSLVEAP